MALALAPPRYLADMREQHVTTGLARAVREHDTAVLFDWIVPLLGLQGVSDRAARAYARERPPVRHGGLNRSLETASCSRLWSWWAFEDCRFRKSSWVCAEPEHQARCPVASLDLRKGSLSIAATGLSLFARDVCGGDLVGWIDGRLAHADPGPGVAGRGRTMRDAVLKPMCNVPGTGAKVWSMVLAELLLGGGAGRERWTAAGATFTVIDSLVHTTLARTGLIGHFGSPHAYGPACWAPSGCAEAIERIAEQVDARTYSAENPRVFPRLLSRALWGLGAEGEWALCNGRRINDAAGCEQRWCPAYECCARLPLR